MDPTVAAAATTCRPFDLALFWQADLVVKSVMVGLLAASVWCWAIIVDKSMLYGRVKSEMKPASSASSGRVRSLKNSTSR